MEMAIKHYPEGYFREKHIRERLSGRAAEMFAWRKKMLLSRSQFALNLGVSLRTAHGWDLGTHQPSNAAYRLFCQLRDKTEKPRKAKRKMVEDDGGPPIEGMGL